MKKRIARHAKCVPRRIVSNCRMSMCRRRRPPTDRFVCGHVQTAKVGDGVGKTPVGLDVWRLMHKPAATM